MSNYYAIQFVKTGRFCHGQIKLPPLFVWNERGTNNLLDLTICQSEKEAQILIKSMFSTYSSKDFKIIKLNDLNVNERDIIKEHRKNSQYIVYNCVSRLFSNNLHWVNTTEKAEWFNSVHEALKFIEDNHLPAIAIYVPKVVEQKIAKKVKKVSKIKCPKCGRVFSDIENNHFNHVLTNKFVNKHMTTTCPDCSSALKIEKLIIIKCTLSK